MDVTGDLMKKVAEDVTSAIMRTLSIAPQPLLPVTISAIGASLGACAAILARMADSAAQDADPECIMLAALLGARLGTSPDDGVEAAYADLAALKAAGRLPLPAALSER